MLDRHFYDPKPQPVVRIEEPCADADALASVHLGAGWGLHSYRHLTHDLKTILRPGYWHSVLDRGFCVGDSIVCYLGDIGSRTVVELGIVSVSHRPRSIEVSIIRRHKETPVDESLFDDEPKAKSRRA
jgi:hypothetical protein